MAVKRTARFRVTFDRLGQDQFPQPLDIEVKDHENRLVLAEEVAEVVHRHAARRLTSRFFEVIVDMTAMQGSIEAGRFGSFTLERLP